MKTWLATLTLLAWVHAGCDSTGGDEDADGDAMDVHGDETVDGTPDPAGDGTEDPADVPADGEDAEDAAEDGTGGVLDCGLPDRSFWTWDLTVMPPGDRMVDATCRGWGPHVAVYVEESVWGMHMSDTEVLAIVETFEESTPADSEHGIWDLVTGTFGPPPDVDGEERIVLLYHSLGEYSGTSFDGFFRAQDEIACSTCNETEMLFLDAVHNPTAGEYMLSIIAHEFQHMIHWQADDDEHTWINEAMSEAAMALCGYYTDVAAVHDFAAHPDVSLVTTSHVHYGAQFLFGLWLTEHLGTSFLHELVAEEANGIEGFDLAASAYSTDMETVFSNWVIANLLDDTTVGGGLWGYATWDPPTASTTTSSPDGVLRSGIVSGWAADYVLWPLEGAGTEIAVTLDSTDHASLRATLVTLDTTRTVPPAVSDLSLAGPSTEQTVPVTDGHDEAVLVVWAPVEGSFDYEVGALW